MAVPSIALCDRPDSVVVPMTDRFPFLFIAGAAPLNTISPAQPCQSQWNVIFNVLNESLRRRVNEEGTEETFPCHNDDDADDKDGNDSPWQLI